MLRHISFVASLTVLPVLLAAAVHATGARPSDADLVRDAAISGVSSSLRGVPVERARTGVSVMQGGAGHPTVEAAIVTALTRMGAVVIDGADADDDGWVLCYSVRGAGIVAREEGRLFRANRLHRTVSGLVLVELTDPAGRVVLADAVPLTGSHTVSGENAGALTSHEVTRHIDDPPNRVLRFSAAALFAAALYIAVR